eukprot:c5385_g1_i1.p1 GENE.c5385_g1_i1~~c5385_g1_i1.p1  ORF type:complete len:247 (-),score=66.83 c5385_g1_i1:63-803(-)
MGIREVGSRIRMMDAIAKLVRKGMKPETSRLTVPSWPVAFLQIFTFSWAQTSEGKSAAQQKDEITTANTYIALVGAVLAATAFDWFTKTTNACYCNAEDCYCSAGFDLEGEYLWAFHFLCGVSAASLICGTVFASLQIIAINEMSDDSEIARFSALLGGAETLPGKLVTFGIAAMVSAVILFVIFTVRLGVFSNQHKIVPWVHLICICGIFFYSLIIALARMIRVVYQAKFSWREKMEAEEMKHVR